MALNVPTNVPSNALVLLSVRAITTLINSPVGEFCATNRAYSLSKLHSTSNRAMAQMEGQQVRNGHDWPPEQLVGHRVCLKHPLQWFVLQDVQGGGRAGGRRVRLAVCNYETSVKKGRTKEETYQRSRTFDNLTTPRSPSTRSKKITVL